MGLHWSLERLMQRYLWRTGQSTSVSQAFTIPMSYSLKGYPKELYYAKLNPNKYLTTQKFIYFFEKLEEQYNTKIAIKALQPDVDAAVVFAQTTKSTKVKTLVAELQQLMSSQTLDENAINAKLETAQKEIDRLNKERLARLIKKVLAKGVQVNMI